MCACVVPRPGVFEQERSEEEYDQFLVSERATKMVTALSLDPPLVRELALLAFQKRIDRGDLTYSFIKGK